MSQTIEVILTVTGDTDVLIFKLDEENPDKYSINLNCESDQENIKSVFTKLLELLTIDDIELELKVSEGYSITLYKEVAKEYIDDLNNELKTVRETLKEKLKE